MISYLLEKMIKNLLSKREKNTEQGKKKGI